MANLANLPFASRGTPQRGVDGSAALGRRAMLAEGGEAARAAGGTVPSASASATAPVCEVFLVRHAERADEAPQHAARAPVDLPWWDPPITERGVDQARHAANQLVAEHQESPFRLVYASPCVRTVQTASYIATTLGVPICLAPGLASCAAAIARMGIGSFAPAAGTAECAATATATPARSDRSSGTNSGGTGPQPRFVTEEEAMALCAAGTRFVRTEASGRYEGFLPCVERLARAESLMHRAVDDATAWSTRDDGAVHQRGADRHGAARRILIVGHREGIRDLCALSGDAHRRTGYCCIARFRYDPSHGASNGDDGATEGHRGGLRDFCARGIRPSPRWTLVLAPT